MAYGTGYVPNPEGYRTVPFGMKSEHSAAAVPDAASLADHLPQQMDQGQTGACVWHAVPASCWTAASKAGRPLPFLPSPDCGYKITRCLDRVQNEDGSFPQLQDEGSQPYRAVQVLTDWGVKPIDAPTPDGRYSDAVPPDPPDSPTGVDAEPDFIAIEQASKKVLVGAYGIYATGAARGAAIRQAIANGFPVCVAVPGGSAQWQGYSGGVIGATGEPNDHYVFIYAYARQPDGTWVYWIKNSWGDWGENGSCRVNDAAIAEFSDLYAMSVHEENAA